MFNPGKFPLLPKTLDIERAELANRVLDISLASVLIVCTSPILLVVYGLVWFASGSPVLYRGTRLGRNRRAFTIYKFRTLKVGAEAAVPTEVLSDRNRLATPAGPLLRETHLDELPQLFNILRGHMSFVGPRPLRPSIYERMCESGLHDDGRFLVRPGLVGVSALYAPHQTPKRLQILLDHRVLAAPDLVFRNGRLIALAAYAFAHKLVACLARLARDLVWRRRFAERRVNGRVALRTGLVRWTEAGRERTGGLVDIDEEAFCFATDEPLAEPPPRHMVLERRFRRRGRGIRRKRAQCRVQLQRCTVDLERFEYVCRYEPVRPFHFYLVHQYFLRSSPLHASRIEL